ncbi:MAG: FAD-binding oxidoreductase [Thermotogota bacterium]
MIKARILEKQIENEYMYLKVKIDKDIYIEPGQFLMIKNDEDKNMAKPFSIMSQNGVIIEFIIKIIGNFTKKLSKKNINDYIYLRGPYGHGFIKKIDKNKKYVLLGGGCGAAPLLHFEEKYPDIVEDIKIGFKDSFINNIIPNEKIIIETKEKSTPVDWLKDNNFENIISCGPKGMFKALKNMNKNTYVSLEENMGCGIGMCKGCPVETIEGIKMVCKDGPLFKLSEVIL